jgi:uncharacterized protein YegP (UPF0339 family)
MKSKWFPAVLLFVVPLLGVGTLGAKTFPLTSSEAVPAAAGKVEVKKDKNGNNELTIKAEHLAQPGRLTPPATTYVVWFQEHNGEPMSQGELRVSKDLTGEFRATTHLSNFDVLITAEGDPTAKNPSGRIVLRTNVQE